MALFSGLPIVLIGGLSKVLGPIPFVSETILGSILSTLSATPVLVLIGIWFLWMMIALILGVIGGMIGGTVGS